MFSGTPSRASSSAWAWRGWWGANPLVHPDLAATAALAVADQDRSAPVVEVVLGERAA
jgi:hypothetical protein